MRVLFDHQIFCWQLYGGVSRYCVELARHLARLDDTEARVVAPLFINRHLCELDASAVDGRFVGATPTGISWFVYSANRLLAPRRMDRFGPDIVHETFYSTKSVVGHHDHKTVLTVHDMIHERFPDAVPDSQKAIAVKARAIKRAHHIICVSQQTRQDLLDIYDVGINNSSRRVKHVALEANDVRMSFFDSRKNMNDVIPDVLLLEGDRLKKQIKPGITYQTRAKKS